MKGWHWWEGKGKLHSDVADLKVAVAAAGVAIVCATVLRVMSKYQSARCSSQRERLLAEGRFD